MAYYRLYFLDDLNHISHAVELECESDEAAISLAQSRANGRAIELWNRERLVWRHDSAAPK